MDPTGAPPATPAGEHAAATTSVLYRALLDSLDETQRRSVLEAIERHDKEVRAAEAAGLRVVEAHR